MFEAVGRKPERLLEVLGGLRAKPFMEDLMGDHLADVVLALFGTATLSKLQNALEANGLNPPGRWSSDDGRAFVESIGFGPEFAASSEARRDAEETISGPITLPDLHDFQQEVFGGLRDLVSSGTGRRRGVVSLPTGGGKTRVVVQASVELMLTPESDNQTVLWVAQTDELCEQAVQAFRQVWINCGTRDTNLNQSLGVDEDRNEELLRRVQERTAEHAQSSILFFANSVAHAEEMAARLHLRGVPAAAISGGTPAAARRDFLEKFKSGKIKVLCNHSVLTTGFDAPKTDMILIARQVFSPVRYMQMVGRGLRGVKNGGTPQCKIVTVNDNLGRFGNKRHYDYCAKYFEPPDQTKVASCA